MENKTDSKLVNSELIQPVTVVDYDPVWVTRYLAESKALIAATGDYFVRLEHFGSTAVPQLKAKPIVDIMAAINHLEDFKYILPALKKLDYKLVETDMLNLYFLPKQDQSTGQSFHLHIVSLESWPERKERIMRDYLVAHPEEARAYGALKTKLAEQYPENSLAYTQAKTDFIQNLLDKAYDKLGIERIDVTED